MQFYLFLLQAYHSCGLLLPELQCGKEYRDEDDDILRNRYSTRICIHELVMQKIRCTLYINSC